jgi:hypothetical protein
MVRTRTRSRTSRRQAPTSVGKPRGVLHPRVELVGPDHFGIVCFDCAKARSKFLVTNFYGRVLIPPTVVTHNRQGLDDAVAQVRQAIATHELRDCLVAIERTGRYHRIVQRAFAAAGFKRVARGVLNLLQSTDQLRGSGLGKWLQELYADTVGVVVGVEAENATADLGRPLRCCIRNVEDNGYVLSGNKGDGGYEPNASKAEVNRPGR